MTITVQHQMLIAGGETAGITVTVCMLCQHDWWRRSTVSRSVRLSRCRLCGIGDDNHGLRAAAQTNRTMQMAPAIRQ
jgi:hypothetical protein